MVGLKCNIFALLTLNGKHQHCMLVLDNLNIIRHHTLVHKHSLSFSLTAQVASQSFRFHIGIVEAEKDFRYQLNITM